MAEKKNDVKFHEEIQKMEYEPMDETELKLIKGGITLGIVLLVVLFVVSAKATYTMDDGVLLMEGDPRLTDGENTVTGETIKYFTEENRSEVMGGSKKRVEAVFSGSKNSSPIRGNR